MPRLIMMPTLVRELTGSEGFPREPEPDLVMDDEEQVLAYAEATRIDGVMSAAYIFHSARISMLISGKKRVIDLGCGPATQLAQIAELNPDVSFLGVDLSPQMIADAEQHSRDLDLNNLEFVENDISKLDKLETDSADAVMSTMTLHHLPTIDHLESCFSEIRRVLKPGGKLYLTDFGRLKSLKSVLFFAYMNKNYQPPVFSRDYERSLRAAFDTSDFSNLAEKIFSEDIQTISTFGIPVLQIVKSPDGELSPQTRQKLKQMRKKLPAKYRRELDDIRFFFWLSGLRNDPFR